MPWLINAAQLDKFKKAQKNVIVLDASWHLPEAKRHAENEFNQRHISGARFLDLNLFHDPDSALPNMLIRDEKKVSELLGSLGVTPEHKIIFYDRSLLRTSCRALWMMMVFGHALHQLYILDGGFDAWEKYGGKLEEGAVKPATPKNYPVNFEAHYIRTLVQVKANIHHPKEQMVDLRHPTRFAGGAEHRAGLRCGHMPGSFSFPYITMFDDNGHWKPIEKIRKQLVSVGIDLDHPIVTTCGSGMTAATLNFALSLMNHEKNALYDGSWCEWASDQLYAGETSLSERPVITSRE